MHRHGRGLPCPLLALPRDALLSVCCALDSADITRLGLACHELAQITTCDDLWQLIMLQRFAPVIDLAFDGACPHPRRGVSSWRAHFLEFSHTWMLRAKQDCGRVILAVSGKVYDATEYVDEHPGMPAFLLSAAGTDATSAFYLAGHSRNAHRILRQFAVPALDAFQPRRGGRASPGAQSAKGRTRSCDDSLADDDARDARARAGKGLGPSDARSELVSWRDVISTLHVLARSPQGRRQLWSTAGNLLNAAVVDMERVGRDPIDSAEIGSIQRFLPVVWRLSCDECAALARLLL